MASVSFFAPTATSRDRRARGGASHEYATTGLPRGRPPVPAPAYVRSRSQGHTPAPPRIALVCIPMVATGPAGVVSLANRVSLQPAHQRLRRAATGDVVLPPLPRRGRSAGRDR